MGNKNNCFGPKTNFFTPLPMLKNVFLIYKFSPNKFLIMRFAQMCMTPNVEMKTETVLLKIRNILMIVK